MKSKYKIIFSVAFFVVLLDQFTKFLIKSNMDLNSSIPVINNIFHLTYIHNFGAGFGIFQGKVVLLALISLIAVGIILFYLDHIDDKDKIMQFAVGLLLGGTVGNLIDRALLGYVVDFFDFRIWPIFNIADSCLTIGVILLIWCFWKNDK